MPRVYGNGRRGNMAEHESGHRSLEHPRRAHLPKMLLIMKVNIEEVYEMTIRIPDSLRDAEINIGVEIPQPEIRMEKGKDGSISLSAYYDMCDISEFAWRAAKELNDDIEKAFIEDLLDLNGYIKERTCRMEYDKNKRGVYCSHCGERMDVYTWEHHVDGTAGYLYPFCYWCGAKVMER